MNEVKLDTKPDGSSQAIIIVDHGKKGLVVGRAGCNAEKARLFAKKIFQYFKCSNKQSHSNTVGDVIFGKITTWFVCRQKFEDKEETSAVVNINI